MSAARHFHAGANEFQVRADIEDDIASAKGAAQSLADAGQYGAAAGMRQQVDGYLDELNSLNNGTWKPKHA